VRQKEQLHGWYHSQRHISLSRDISRDNVHKDQQPLQAGGQDGVTHCKRAEMPNLSSQPGCGYRIHRTHIVCGQSGVNTQIVTAVYIVMKSSARLFYMLQVDLG
jgi:hypothetical protein